MKYYCLVTTLWIIWGTSCLCVLNADEPAPKLYDDDLARAIIGRDPITSGTIYDYFTKNDVDYPKPILLKDFWKSHGIDPKQIKLIGEGYHFTEGYAHYRLSKKYDLVFRLGDDGSDNEKRMWWLAIVPRCEDRLAIAIDKNDEIWKSWTIWQGRLGTVEGLERHKRLGTLDELKRQLKNSGKQ